MSIKRYDWDSQEEADGNFVLYTDHAAEVSDWAASQKKLVEDLHASQDEVSALRVKMETAQQLKVAIEDEANRTEASLRTQLEAAKQWRPALCWCEGYGTQHHREGCSGLTLEQANAIAKQAQLTAQPSACPRCKGEYADSDCPVCHGLGQLTAQPDGVRPRPWTADGYIVRDANGDGFAECPTKADALLLTTPAAKETKP